MNGIDAVRDNESLEMGQMGIQVNDSILRSKTFADWYGRLQQRNKEIADQ